MKDRFLLVINKKLLLTDIYLDVRLLKEITDSELYLYNLWEGAVYGSNNLRLWEAS